VSAALADTSLVGYVLAGKYQIVREIGRGGMGVVYEAEHLQLGGRVAIKLMLEKYVDDNEAVRRFEREAVAASRIGDAHIIQVIDIGQAPDGRSFVVMELLNGLPLTRVLERTGPMPPWRAVHIMKQVLLAIGAAHSKGIIHRDLKPDNIFLLGDDFVKVLDFGIAKVVDPDEQVAFTKLTSTGVVMGTPLYMAPEQAMGQPIERGADIYACGVILYELLAGRPPFEGQTYAVLVAKLLTQPPEYLGNLRPNLPLALVNAVHKALEKEPHARFATAEQFAASLPGDRTPSEIELAGTLDSGMAMARLVPTQRTSSKRGTWIAIALAMLLGVATAGVLIATQVGAGQRTEPVAEDKPAASEEPKVTPLPEPRTETGTLELAATQDGAKLFIDDQQRGVNQVTITLAKGMHDIRVELDGHQPYLAKVEVEPNVKTKLVLPELAKVGKKPIVGQRPTITKVQQPTGPRVGPDKRPPVIDTVPKVDPKTVAVPRDPDVAPPPKVKTGPAPTTGPDSKPNPYTKPNPY
jgi:hypothetical protein